MQQELFRIAHLAVWLQKELPVTNYLCVRNSQWKRALSVSTGISDWNRIQEIPSAKTEGSFYWKEHCQVQVSFLFCCMCSTQAICLQMLLTTGKGDGMKQYESWQATGHSFLKKNMKKKNRGCGCFRNYISQTHHWSMLAKWPRCLVSSVQTLLFLLMSKGTTTQFKKHSLWLRGTLTGNTEE